MWFFIYPWWENLQHNICAQKLNRNRIFFNRYTFSWTLAFKVRVSAQWCCLHDSAGPLKVCIPVLMYIQQFSLCTKKKAGAINHTVAHQACPSDIFVTLAYPRSPSSTGTLQYIVACQRGGVSNKPALGSGQRQDTGPGILYTKKINKPHVWIAFFTKTGWAWHVTICFLLVLSIFITTVVQAIPAWSFTLRMCQGVSQRVIY